MSERHYLIRIETNTGGFSAYAPELPGCVTTGTSREDVEHEMQEAIAFHLQGLHEAGEPIPEPSGLTRPTSKSPHSEVGAGAKAGPLVDLTVD